MRNNLPQLGNLLREKIDVNCQATRDESRDGFTVPNIGEVDYVSKGYSPLHLVAANGNINVARLLMGAKADVNMEDFAGQTPLHVAAECDEAALVAILIEEGGDLAKEDLSGDNPMHVAVKA